MEINIEGLNWMYKYVFWVNNAEFYEFQGRQKEA